MVQETTIKRYIGLSTDTKPSSPIQVGSVIRILAGSEWYELDTGVTYVFDGSSAWTPKLVNLGNGTGDFINSDNPFPVYGGYVPIEYSRTTTNTIKSLVNKGQLNKFVIYPRIGNEHVESSREIQGVVTNGNIVGQIFKASKDNISALLLTIESAEAQTIDTFETYSNDGELQTSWVEITNPAVISTSIVKTGDQAMALPLTTTGDEWVLSAPSDYTDYTGSFDFYQDVVFGVLGAEVSVFISDGTNSKSFPLVINITNSWTHFDVLESNMIEDQAETTDTTNILTIGFRIIRKKNGATVYIDNLIATPAPGELGIKLWNMGNTLPIDGVTSIDDGTQYTRLGKTLTSSFSLPLVGGKRLYHAHMFNAALDKNVPDNEPLITDNYYLIELYYIDTNVSVYGPDTSFNTQYYNNGYSFTTANEASVINAIGPYSDIMFTIMSTQSVYVIEAGWRFDAEPNGDSDLYVFIENKDMQVTDTVVDHEEHPEQKHSHDVSIRPMIIDNGGKIEFYNNDDASDQVSNIVYFVTFLYEPPIVNG
ncbi:MAG: hypothetical protein GQ540_03565 [Lutibacter sp.]|uniref:hypothetical protein n=1 Tax=Lutibacter sp. TaxID=1925666 RepID=UPI0019E90728|nr:hypothetical protein [Lutibacter sp.]NOR27590.1 hypothetical protein [Lutibacter sp.]